MFEDRPGVDVGMTTVIKPVPEVSVAPKENSFAWLQSEDTGHEDSIRRATVDPELHTETLPLTDVRSALSPSLPKTVSDTKLMQDKHPSSNAINKNVPEVKGSVGSVGDAPVPILAKPSITAQDLARMVGKPAPVSKDRKVGDKIFWCCIYVDDMLMTGDQELIE